MGSYWDRIKLLAKESHALGWPETSWPSLKTAADLAEYRTYRLLSIFLVNLISMDPTQNHFTGYEECCIHP